MKRRNFFKLAAALPVIAMLPKKSQALAAPKEILVVGGGMGGAAAARYLKLWGGSSVNVTLITKETSYSTCIQSNLVITGAQSLSSITRNYKVLKNNGITVLQGAVTGITPGTQASVSYQLNGAFSSTTRSYDYVLLSPGIVPIPDSIPGDPNFSLSFWEGNKATALKTALDAMPNGGTFVISIPSGTYKGALAPYGRACVVADYLASRNIKVIVLDGHPNNATALDFLPSFSALGIEYHFNETVSSVTLAPIKTLVSSQGSTYSCHVANVIPPQKAVGFPLTNTALYPLLNGGSFYPVDAQTFASKIAGYSNVYVIGDAAATGLPKSGHAAVDEAKIASAAILSTINGISPETSLAVSAVQFNAIRSTSDHTAVYAHSGFQWNATAHSLPNLANQNQTANSWVASGSFLNAGGADSDANVSSSSGIQPAIGYYNQGLTWRNALLADAFGF